MDRISVLQHCCDVLATRETSDPLYAWAWSIRRKAVHYCLELEKYSRHPAAGRPLTADDKQAIEATHPLLRQIEARSSPRFPRPDTDWQQILRQRASSYLDSINAVRETDAK
jgi:hypothetical protein